MKMGDEIIIFKYYFEKMELQKKLDSDQGIGVRVQVGARIYSSSRRPYRLWGPRNLLSKG
jgi:hypothetical protein